MTQYFVAGILLVVLPPTFIFGWILWRELRPVERETTPIRLAEFVHDMSAQCDALAGTCTDGPTKTALQKLSFDLERKEAEIRSNFVDDSVDVSPAPVAFWSQRIEATLMVTAECTVILLAIQYWLALPPTSLVLGYFAPIVFIASRYGFWSAALTLVGSAILAAFIFYPPRFSIYISDGNEFAELLAFSVTALLAIMLVGRNTNSMTPSSH